MSKIAFFADIHAHAWQEFGKTLISDQGDFYLPMNSRLFDLISALHMSFESARKKGCTHLVVLGDVFHVRGQIATDVMQAVYNLFKWAQDELGLNIIILTGNHDQADKSGRIHSVYALQGVATIVDTPAAMVVDGLKGTFLYFIPYTASHEDLLSYLDEAETMAKRNKCPTKILCMHAGVDGATIGPIEYKIKDPLTVESLGTESFTQILLGHYHKPQTLADNVRYVGSPVQHTRGEAGDSKRWIMWDEDHIRSIKIKGKQFYSYKASQLAEVDFQPGYYDITLDDKNCPLETVQATFLDHPDCSLKIVSTRKGTDKKSRIKVDADMSDRKLLNRYLKHLDKADPALLQEGVDYLGRATNAQSAKTSLKFNHVVIDNFLSIGHAELNLDRSGDVIAVLGDNQDSEGFDSNGSGKSSLLPESIYWCLFGVTARDIPAADVVNNVAKRDCCVKLSITCDTTVVVVERFRKLTGKGTGLTVSLDTHDITQGSIAETEKLLWQLLGLDYLTFSSIVAFSPDNLQFVSGTDASQKQVLDSILQTSRFSAALDLVKASVKGIKTSRQSDTEDLRTVEGGVNTLRGNIADYKLASTQFVEKEKKRRKDLQEKIDAEQVVLVDLNKDLSGAVKDITAKKAEIADLVKNREDVTDLQGAKEKLNHILGGIQADLKASKTSLKDVETRLANVANQAGKPCPTCGQPVLNTAKLMAQLSTDRSTHTDKIKLLEAKIVLINERFATISESMKEYNKQVDLKEAAEEVLATLERSRNIRATRIAEHKATIQGLTASLSTRPENEYKSKLIPAAETKLAEALAQAEDLTNSLALSQVTLDMAEFWVTGFGNGGVKSFLFDQIIPELTEYANYYVDKLAGDSLSIEFSTHSAEGKEKFSIKAFNTGGSDLYAGNSSGEKRRIDVCVMLALFRVANNRVKLPLLLMDEVFDTLDASGIEGIVAVLEELAQDLDLTIFVTSHSTLTSMLHQSITVRKVNGVATLLED